jgi:hypothetical protein
MLDHSASISSLNGELRIDADVCALGVENLRDIAGASDQIGMPVGVDDVVQITRAASFSQSSEFLAEQFG